MLTNPSEVPFLTVFGLPSKKRQIVANGFKLHLTATNIERRSTGRFSRRSECDGHIESSIIFPL